MLPNLGWILALWSTNLAALHHFSKPDLHSGHLHLSDFCTFAPSDFQNSVWTPWSELALFLLRTLLSFLRHRSRRISKKYGFKAAIEIKRNRIEFEIGELVPSLGWQFGGFGAFKHWRGFGSTAEEAAWRRKRLVMLVGCQETPCPLGWSACPLFPLSDFDSGKLGCPRTTFSMKAWTSLWIGIWLQSSPAFCSNPHSSPACRFYGWLRIESFSWCHCKWCIWA